MSRLGDAIVAAEARKAALFGKAEGSVANFSTEEQHRALISGWDIDLEEMRSYAQQAAQFFVSLAAHTSLTYTHESAWAEGLLVGLLAGSLPHDPDVGGMDAADSGYSDNELR